jgi:maltooligosyltrehalose trehalohydrolase
VSGVRGQSPTEGARRSTGAGGRLPSIGARVRRGGGVEFRVWAPDHGQVEVILVAGPGAESASRAHALRPETGGYHAAVVPTAGVGTRYRYRLDGGACHPDPASRFQPEGPRGPSEVVDPTRFPWTDRGWPGISRRGLVLYEMHVGTFTPEGTWRAAAAWLADLAALGVTAVELMPVAEFPGRFGWGYDGVNLFAPYHGYGRPDEMRRFVNEAHGHGLGVLLDVVLNRLAPSECPLEAFARAYRSPRHATEWGAALNFDGPGSLGVRAFVLRNLAYWLEEFHIDGFRFDAAHEFHDTSQEHILAQAARRAREVSGGRGVLLIAENEPQQAWVVRPASGGGMGFDAQWSEDFHHVARGALTGRREAYLADYHATPQEFVSLLKRGFLYQGQYNARQGQPRGTPANDLPPESFVFYLENHDQAANALGHRFAGQGDPSLGRALTAVLLLAPQPPLLFQGQEFAASNRFAYFADAPERSAEIRRQREEFLAQFPTLATPEARAAMPAPTEAATFEAAKLDHGERDRPGHIEWIALHRDLLRLRREDRVFRDQAAGGIDGAVLSDRAFVMRYFGDSGEDRLLVVNLGDDLRYAPVSEPLLAPPEGSRWALVWSSESIGYGGLGTPPVIQLDGWHLPARCALVFTREPDSDD